ncbi:MAG: phosphatidylglycerophosphatase A [Candidatus Aminicenantes bacterium]|nr:phosphatidylglycerophosphatase A [Candidatus Aminicenantes bacterium]
MNRILLTVATFFNIGRITIAPGTWASLVTTATLFVIRPYIHSPISGIISLVLIIIMGIPAAGYAEKYFNKKDPHECVIDEVAGQMLCLILIPYSLTFYLAAFFIFRIFDIFKPFPIRQAEKIGSGLGIMMDDLIAGLYTAGILRLVMVLKPLIF